MSHTDCATGYHGLAINREHRLFLYGEQIHYKSHFANRTNDSKSFNIETQLICSHIDFGSNRLRSSVYYIKSLINVYILYTTSVLQATRLVDQANSKYLKSKAVLRIKPRFFLLNLHKIETIHNKRQALYENIHLNIPFLSSPRYHPTDSCWKKCYFLKISSIMPFQIVLKTSKIGGNILMAGAKHLDTQLMLTPTHHFS